MDCTATKKSETQSLAEAGLSRPIQIDPFLREKRPKHGDHLPAFSSHDRVFAELYFLVPSVLVLHVMGQTLVFKLV